MARVEHGVRSLSLYRRQAEAIYMVGGFAAAAMVLTKIENLLEEQHVETMANL